MNFNNVKALHIPEGDVIRIQSRDTVLWEKYFEQKASGEIISLNNSINGTISGLSLFGKSTQNGTPTPTSPIPIENIVNPTIRTTGKNLIKFDDFTLVAPNTGADRDNFRYKPVAFNPPLSANGYACTVSCKVQVLSGNIERISFLFRLKQGDVKCTDSVITNGFVNVNAPSAYWDEVFIYAGVIGETRGNSVAFSDIQIELGSTATAYEPYKSGGSATINRTLCGIGDVKDELIVNKDGTGKFVQRIGHRTFDGSESWAVNAYLGSGDERWARFTLRDTTLPTDAQNTDKIYRVIADKLHGVTAYMDAASNQHGTYSVSIISNNRFSVFLAPSYDTQDKCKAWFRENNTTIQYELATPIETDLTAEEVNAILSLKTFEPCTVVQNDKGAEMTVRYVGTHKGEGLI